MSEQVTRAWSANSGCSTSSEYAAYAASSPYVTVWMVMRTWSRATPDLGEPFSVITTLARHQTRPMTTPFFSAVKCFRCPVLTIMGMVLGLTLVFSLA